MVRKILGFCRIAFIIGVFWIVLGYILTSKLFYDYSGFGVSLIDFRPVIAVNMVLILGSNSLLYLIFVFRNACCIRKYRVFIRNSISISIILSIQNVLIYVIDIFSMDTSKFNYLIGSRYLLMNLDAYVNKLSFIDIVNVGSHLKFGPVFYFIPVFQLILIMNIILAYRHYNKLVVVVAEE